MDEADMSQDRAEKEAPYMLAASRKPTGPTATGRCLYCGEILGDNQRWCDGSRYPLTVLDFPRDKDKVHPTQKPVALVEYLVRTYTAEGDTVLDNTMGSGTTGVACENTGRKFIGIERDPTYFDVAVGRVSDAALFGSA